MVVVVVVAAAAEMADFALLKVVAVAVAVDDTDAVCGSCALVPLISCTSSDPC
jgi:hypothetical protein